jgi:glycosyltransferase involved in cell wall biosynthesis
MAEATHHTDRRKIVVLTSSYPLNRDDFAGRFVADAVEQLRTRGLEVEVVYPDLPRDGGGLVRLLRHRPWRAISLFVSLSIRVRRAARDADLVHAHWLASAFIARLAGRPFVVTLHGTGSAGRFSDLSLATKMPWLVRFLLRPARAVICVSEQLTDSMHAIGVAQARWIPNGVAIPELNGAAEAEPFVLYAGRLSPEKGISQLLEATRDLPLVVAGDGPLRSLVPGALGFLPHVELERLYASAAVVVLPSLHEGVPVCLLEAMAHGRAVVATNVGGMPELVEDGYTGILVEPGDPKALRAAIERLLADAELRESLGRAARARVRQICSWDQVIDATLEAYRNGDDPRRDLAHDEELAVW